MSDTHSDDEGGDLGLFAEPEGYYQPEKQPTFASHAMQDGRELTLRMVGHNPLWVRVYNRLLSLAHGLAPSRCL
jgi:hypothetical protein